MGLIALTVAPGLAIAIYVYWRDRFDKDPLFLLVICFLLGALSIIPAVVIEEVADNLFHLDEAKNILGSVVEAFIFIGLVEEGCKYACLRLFIFRRKEFNEPYDGITFSVMIAIGFATVENFFYVYSGNGLGGVGTAWLRAFTAVPSHAANAVMMGYFVGLAKMNPAHSTRLCVTGLLVAVFFHGAYDFFFTQSVIPGITGGAIVALIVSIILSLRAIALHQRHSPFDNGKKL